ncbi:hypothetical protein X777_10009, partial [Ooceraea biroi]
TTTTTTMVGRETSARAAIIARGRRRAPGSTFHENFSCYGSLSWSRGYARGGRARPTTAGGGGTPASNVEWEWGARRGRETTEKRPRGYEGGKWEREKGSENPERPCEREGITRARVLHEEGIRKEGRTCAVELRRFVSEWRGRGSTLHSCGGMVGTQWQFEDNVDMQSGDPDVKEYNRSLRYRYGNIVIRDQIVTTASRRFRSKQLNRVPPLAIFHVTHNGCRGTTVVNNDLCSWDPNPQKRRQPIPQSFIYLTSEFWKFSITQATREFGDTDETSSAGISSRRRCLDATDRPNRR